MIDSNRSDFKRKWSQYKEDLHDITLEDTSQCLITDHSTKLDHSTNDINQISILERGDITIKTVDIWRNSLSRLGIDSKRISTTYNPLASHVVIPTGCSIEKVIEWSGVHCLSKNCIAVSPQWIMSFISNAGKITPNATQYIHPLNTQLHLDTSTNTSQIINIPNSSSTDTISHEKSKTDEKIACPVTIDRNSKIISEFEQLQEIYEVEGDEWRALAYKKCCAQLAQMKPIKSIESLKNVKGFGSSIIEKIKEILEYGYLPMLQTMKIRPEIISKLQFCKIFGIGPTIAKKLYDKGYRNINDLRQRGLHDLTNQQLIGLKWYEDLQQRIPRTEIEQITNIVKAAAEKLYPGVECTTCGSYRRGKATSGDVDILIYPPCTISNSNSTELDTNAIDEIHILHPLIDDLTAMGFLTDHLSIPGNELDHDGRLSYYGICKVPGEHSLHRRIDIKTYPRRFVPFALLYFTGSDHFNRSMRAYADKIGFKLSDKTLIQCTITKGADGKRIRHNDHSIPCNTEKDIFDILGLPYKEPWERNCMDIGDPTEDHENDNNDNESLHSNSDSG